MKKGDIVTRITAGQGVILPGYYIVEEYYKQSGFAKCVELNYPRIAIQYIQPARLKKVSCMNLRVTLKEYEDIQRTSEPLILLRTPIISAMNIATKLPILIHITHTGKTGVYVKLLEAKKVIRYEEPYIMLELQKL